MGVLNWIQTIGIQEIKQKTICAPVFPLYYSHTMNDPLALIDLLDWNCDPHPSPYQRTAWLRLLEMPSETVLPLLEAFRAGLVKRNANYYPYNYERAFIRCKATNKTNL